MKRFKENADWYRVQYNIAAIFANWAAITHDPAEKRKLVTAAEAETAQLLQSIDRTRSWRARGSAHLRRLVGRRHKHDDVALRAFLDRAVEPAALVLWAGLRQPDQRGETPRSEIAEQEEGARPEERPTLTSKDVQDALAAVRAESRKPPYAKEALKRLTRDILSGRPPSSDDVVDRVAALAEPDPSLDYNLACYHAQRGDLVQAEHCARRTLAGTPQTARHSLGERLKRDPTLKPLGERLSAVLKDFGLDPEAAPIRKGPTPIPRGQREAERPPLGWLKRFRRGQ
jgi:hypothetical protein